MSMSSDDLDSHDRNKLLLNCYREINIANLELLADTTEIDTFSNKRQSVSLSAQESQIHMKTVAIHAIKFTSNVFNYARHNLMSEIFSQVEILCE